MKQFRQLIIGLAIAVLAVYYTLRHVSLHQLLLSFKSVHYLYLIPAVAMIVGIYVARAYRWQILISPLKKAPVKEMYSPLMIGFMGNILPARAGEILRAYLLSKKQNISFSGALATIVVERVFDLFMVILLFAGVMVFYADEVFTASMVWGGIPIRSLAVKFGWMCTGFIIALILFIYMLAHRRELMMSVIRRCVAPFPHKAREKIVSLTEMFSEGLLVAKDGAALVKVMFFTVLAWALIILSYYPFYGAYGIQNDSMESLLILTLMVCIFITILPTPAFLGSFQAGVLIALHDIMGEPEVTVVSLGMVAWALNFLMIVLMGVYHILNDHLSVQQLVNIEKEGETALKKTGPET